MWSKKFTLRKRKTKSQLMRTLTAHTAKKSADRKDSVQALIAMGLTAAPRTQAEAIGQKKKIRFWEKQ